jgi:Spy/CpxP family protein refolding chaperone
VQVGRGQWRPDDRADVTRPERRSAALGERWRSRRIAMMQRRLGLDDEQRRRLTDGLRPLEAGLRASRQQLEAARQRFEAALARADHAAAQHAAAEVSRAQSHLDSLSAQAMLREIEVLTPEQRDRYLRWTFRPGRRGRRGAGMAPALGP